MAGFTVIWKEPYWLILFHQYFLYDTHCSSHEKSVAVYIHMKNSTTLIWEEKACPFFFSPITMHDWKLSLQWALYIVEVYVLRVYNLDLLQMCGCRFLEYSSTNNSAYYQFWWSTCTSQIQIKGTKSKIHTCFNIQDQLYKCFLFLSSWEKAIRTM